MGTIAGGLGSYAANRLNVVAGMKQAKHARNNEMQDRRYAVHLTMVGAVDDFYEQSRKFQNALHYLENIPTALESYQDSWTRYSDQIGSALLAGPKKVNDVFVTLTEKISDYANLLDDWHRANAEPEGVGDARAAFKAAKKNYVDTARECLAPELK